MKYKRFTQKEAVIFNFPAKKWPFIFSTNNWLIYGVKKYIFRGDGIVLRRCEVPFPSKKNNTILQKSAALINIREYLGIFRFSRRVFEILVRPAYRGRTRFIRGEFNSFSCKKKLFLFFFAFFFLTVKITSNIDY